MSDRFEFLSYSIDKANYFCRFNYKAVHNGTEHLYTEILQLPKQPTRSEIPSELIDRILGYLHLAIGVSYYKIYAPSEVVLKSPLNKIEATFFNKLYKKGLGEFYFKNNLNINKSPQFPAESNENKEPFVLGKNAQEPLVGLGGGKDSIVTLESLKEQGFNPTAFVIEGVNENAVIESVAKIAGVPVLKVKRVLDEKLLSPTPDSYNGHIPVSAIYSLIGYLLAILYDFSYVVVGNEHSSNFGNITYQTVEVNHQWSKSIEYETELQRLAKSHLSPDVTYFSLMRPFYEIRIVKQFIRYQRYFTKFSSCNRAFKINNPNKALWCGECAKCVFVFTLFSAFLKPDEIVKIFSQNLYEKDKLTPLFKDVLGVGSMKPFDCVGTFDEAKVAFEMAGEWYSSAKIYQQIKPLITITEEQKKQVFRTVATETVPHQFRFSGMDNVLIIGYGKEGKAAEEYLLKKHPNIEISIADEKTHPENFLKQEEFDIAVRSPGVSKQKVKIYSTSGTNLFFSQNKERTIGVTGTKGKSTVTTLIGHILKNSGRNVKVLGNIGEPLISELLVEGSKDCLYIVELSSYQLDDLDYSPHIAVATSLYNDHLDYHKEPKLYAMAKQNITKHQNSKDLFIYNKTFKEFEEWASNSKARSKSFDTDLKIDMSAVALKGEHNRDNMNAAISVCREFGLSDDDINNGLQTYKPLPHRMENVGTFKEITFYDDAIAVIPEATIAALGSLQNVDTLLLGGTDRGYDFSELEKIVKQKGVRNLVLFPDTGKKMFVNNREEFNVLETESMKDAVDFAYQNTKTGSICLLSTASPSYKLWKDFEEKGDEFQKWVKELSYK